MTRISRRLLIGVAVGAGASAAVGAVAIAGPDARPAAPARRGGARYHPGPGDPGLRGPGDMIMEHARGVWQSHLLPFARPFPDRVAVVAELRRLRAQRLLG